MQLCRLAVVCLLAVPALFALPRAALANTFDFYGFEPRGMGMAGAQVATADDHTAAYFNPSLLAFQKSASVGASFNWINPNMDVSTIDDDLRPLKPVSPDDSLGWTLGFVFPFGGKLENRLSLGVGLSLPTAAVLRAETIDPNRPNWYHHQSGNERLTIAASLGVRITDWLSLGVGLQVLGGIIGNIDFELDATEFTFDSRAFKADVLTAMSPLAGLTLNFDAIGLRIGFGYRGPIEVEYSLPTVFRVMGDLGDGRKELAVIDFLVTGIVHYSPHTFTFGAQWKVIDPLLLTLEARFALWSKAPDPTVNVRLGLDSDVELLQELLGDSFDATGKGSAPQFSDTLSLRLGVEYWFVPQAFALRAGYAFIPTPIPLQNGSTNFLDGDTHAVSIGAGLFFRDPLEIFKEPIAFEVAYQMHIIPEREATKQASSPIASYAYSGNINALSASLRYAF
ncbi:MAG: outer membrane protein transport protein [Myxococcales bacterium]|jgi:long-subunit fatty acid transport protein|nr:outer membrane protein transport protein [Myxococcales bacterium]